MTSGKTTQKTEPTPKNHSSDQRASNFAAQGDHLPNCDDVDGWRRGLSTARARARGGKPDAQAQLNSHDHGRRLHDAPAWSELLDRRGRVQRSRPPVNKRGTSGTAVARAGRPHLLGVQHARAPGEAAVLHLFVHRVRR